jgi:elongation factor G
VPRIAFVNKCDRSGANPDRVVQGLRDKLNHNAVLMQLPIGLEADFEGVVDLIDMKAVYFRGDSGERIEIAEIPDALRELADERRAEMLDAVSMFSDELLEAALEDAATPEMIHKAVRNGVLSLELTPVFIGSAYKNKGVQPLMDAINAYLPSPLDFPYEGLDLDNDNAPVELTSDPDGQSVSYAFKLDEGRYGQLTFIRVYQGTLGKGDTVFHARTGKKIKIGRVARIHADKLEDLDRAGAGDIVGLFGIDCHSGDTFVGNGPRIAMTSMHVPDPVISLSVTPVDSKAQDNMSKALSRFTKEDPTFRVTLDPESNETIVSGMGELHLDVYIERMKREYNAEVETGAPQVAYREAISQVGEFDYTHKKQTGGSGQYAKIVGRLEPLEEGEYEFEDLIRGGSIPGEFIPSCDKGFRSAMVKGTLIGFPIVGVKAVLVDGNTHPVDSSDMAFQTASRAAFKLAYKKAKPRILEPVMKVAVEGPGEFQGAIYKSLMARRGNIIGSTEDEGFARVEAEVPLAEMFGYSTDLRSQTQGKAEFTMEFSRYAPVPREVSEELLKQYKGQAASEDDE